MDNISFMTPQGPFGLAQVTASPTIGAAATIAFHSSGVKSALLAIQLSSYFRTNNGPQRQTPSRARVRYPRAANAADGSHTHFASLTKVSRPREEAKAPSPMGETLIGRKGKKYRLLLKGANKPTPNPPSVDASSIGWDNVDKNKNEKMTIGLLLS
jgi:hypothetical protein